MVNQRGSKLAVWLLVVALFSGILSGCSNSKAATAKVDEKLELAVKYLSEQKFEEAIIAYQDVIKIDSKNVTAYKGISLAYILQQKADLAEQALQDGSKAIPQSAELQLAMAGLMIDRGNNDQAETIYKALIGSPSPSIASFQAYSDFLLQQDKITEAITILEQAVTKNSNDYQLNSILAECYYKGGEREKAIAAINKSISNQPEQSSVFDLLTKIYTGKWDDLIALGDQYIQQNQAKTGQIIKLSASLGKGKNAEVIKLYDALTSDLKGNASLRYITAKAYDKLSQKAQSIQMIKDIKVDEIKDAFLLANLAEFYLENGDKENARKLAMQGIALNESLSDNYFLIYQSYLDENSAMQQYWYIRYRLVSNYSSKRIDNEFNSILAQVYVHKANVIRDQNAAQSTEQYSQALDYYQKAMNIAPNYYEAYTNRAITYNKMLVWDKGLSDCNKAIELDPSNANAYNLRAWTYNTGLGDYVKAREDALKAIALDSGFYEAYNQLSVAYIFQGQYDQAIEAANAGIRVNPDYCWLYEDLGWAYMSLRQYDSAKIYIIKAADFSETRAKASENLETLKKLGY